MTRKHTNRTTIVRSYKGLCQIKKAIVYTTEESFFVKEREIYGSIRLRQFFPCKYRGRAALIGLLFVAIAVAPESTVMGGAPIERRAVAALLNAFFVSFGALQPHTNMAWLTLVMSLIGITNSLFLGFTTLRKPSSWQMAIRRIVLVLVSLVLYGFELSNAIQLIIQPNNISYVVSLSTLVISVYSVGIIRAWELLGASRFGFFRWFNPLYDINEKGSAKANTDEEKTTVSMEEVQSN